MDKSSKWIILGLVLLIIFLATQLWIAVKIGERMATHYLEQTQETIKLDIHKQCVNRCMAIYGICERNNTIEKCSDYVDYVQKCSEEMNNCAFTCEGDYRYG